MREIRPEESTFVPWIRRCLSLGVGLVLGGCVTQPERVLSPAEIDEIRTIQSDDTREEVLNLEPDELKAYLVEFVESPVDFHGLVINENGEPVEGAKIEVLLFDRVLEPLRYPYLTGPFLPARKTDRKGSFEITGTEGAAILITVSKRGYRPSGHSRRVYRFPPELQGKNEYPLPSKEEPAEFQLIDNDDSALRRIATGAIPLPAKGGITEISLRRYTPHGVEPDEGDLRVTYARGKAGPDGRFDWKCKISVPGGGIQRYDDLSKDLAPEDGYADSLTIERDADSEDWADRVDQFLVLRMGDGNYAFVQFRVRTQGDAFFGADGTWNSAGDRHLARYY